MFLQFFSPRGGILNIFSASHRNKNAEVHKIFTSLPASEKLIDGKFRSLQPRSTFLKPPLTSPLKPIYNSVPASAKQYKLNSMKY